MGDELEDYWADILPPRLPEPDPAPVADPAPVSPLDDSVRGDGRVLWSGNLQAPLTYGVGDFEPDGGIMGVEPAPIIEWRNYDPAFTIGAVIQAGANQPISLRVQEGGVHIPSAPNHGATVANPGANMLWADNIPKAYGVIRSTVDGSGIELRSSFGVASVWVSNDNQSINVTLTTPMESQEYVVLTQVNGWNAIIVLPNTLSDTIFALRVASTYGTHNTTYVPIVGELFGYISSLSFAVFGSQRTDPPARLGV